MNFCPYTCPICGRYARKPHHCSPNVYRSIDAAHRRAGDGEPHNSSDPSRRCYAERLSDGFAMLGDDPQPLRGVSNEPAERVA